MGIWLFRAGKRGQFEEKFLTDSRIYLTWNRLNIDLNQYKNREKLLQKLQEVYPSEKMNTLKIGLPRFIPLRTRWRSETGLFCQVSGQIRYILAR